MDAAPTESMRSNASRLYNATKMPESVSSAVNLKLSGKRSVDEGNGAPDEAGAVFWQRESGVNTRCDSQDLGAVISWCVQKID